MKDRIRVRALVIDDDDSVCRRLRSWLKDVDVDALTFVDAAEGLRHARGATYEIALVDLRLPDLDSAEIIAGLINRCPRAPVLAMCAFPEPEQVSRAMSAGARDLLEKPVQRDALYAAVERQLAAIGINWRNERSFNSDIGSRLRHVRLSAGRTQQEIAQLANITAAQLSQIELGKTATSTWTLARICGALHTEIATIFENGSESRA